MKSRFHWLCCTLFCAFYSTSSFACWPLIKPAFYIACGSQQVAGVVESVAESGLDVTSGKVVSEIRIRVTEKWGMSIGPYLKVRVIIPDGHIKNSKKDVGALKLVGGCFQRPVLVNDEVIVAPAPVKQHSDKTIIYAEVTQVQDFGGAKTKSEWRSELAQKTSCKNPSVEWRN